MKPQFFEMYRRERDNLSLLDDATAYLVKKAVAASVYLSDSPIAKESQASPWGGVLSRFTSSTEIVPMALKIQQASKGDER